MIPIDTQRGTDRITTDKLTTDQITNDALAEWKSIREKMTNRPEPFPHDPMPQAITAVIQTFSDVNLSGVLLPLSRKDPYTYRHSLGVALISCLIGQGLGMRDEERNELAVAGLLHDIGKMKIPDAILKKAGGLSADEYAEMKLHTRYGYEMIRALPGTTEEQALVALQHHEREDGSGYPFGIPGRRITRFSKIVAVADVFHAMISERVYRKATPLFRVLEEIDRGASGLFHPLIVHTLIRQVMNRQVGSVVFLTGGQAARIVSIHPDDPLRPLVESQGQRMDLRRSGQRILDFAEQPPR